MVEVLGLQGLRFWVFEGWGSGFWAGNVAVFWRLYLSVGSRRS